MDLVMVQTRAQTMLSFMAVVPWDGNRRICQYYVVFRRKKKIKEEERTKGGAED